MSQVTTRPHPPATQIQHDILAYVKERHLQVHPTSSYASVTTTFVFGEQFDKDLKWIYKLETIGVSRSRYWRPFYSSDMTIAADTANLLAHMYFGGTAHHKADDYTSMDTDHLVAQIVDTALHKDYDVDLLRIIKLSGTDLSTILKPQQPLLSAIIPFVIRDQLLPNSLIPHEWIFQSKLMTAYMMCCFETHVPITLGNMIFAYI